MELKEQEKELRLGFMSNEELAEWCSKSLETFKRNRRRWCEKKLSNYADHEILKDGVNILLIKEPVYNLSAKKEVEKKFPKYWGTPGSHIDTSRNCWNKMSKDMSSAISDTTGYSYVTSVKREWYGVSFGKTKRSGTKGDSQLIYCKTINGEGYHFTEEEDKIRKELMHIYLTNRENQILDLKKLRRGLAQGEITKEEYDNFVDHIIDCELGWNEFQAAFEEKIGYPTDFRTELVDDVIKQKGIVEQSFEWE